VTEDKVRELLENKDVTQSIRELLLDGYTPEDIKHVAIQLYMQLGRLMN
jgi:hypothetical protein